MAKPRNFLFDFGNVIIDLDLEGAQDNITSLLDPKYDAGETEKAIYTLIEKYEVGRISTELFINGLLKYARSGVQALDMINAWNSMLIGIPPYRLTMLEKMKREYGIYLLSNTNLLHLEWVYHHLERDLKVVNFDRRFFDDTYYSHLIGYRKPDKSCFEYVFRDSMITPENTLFIDDNPQNIKAAAELGFQVHLSPADEEIAEIFRLKGYY